MRITYRDTPHGPRVTIRGITPAECYAAMTAAYNRGDHDDARAYALGLIRAAGRQGGRTGQIPLRCLANALAVHRTHAGEPTADDPP